MALGGRVKLMISGGAPLLQDVKNFMKIVMCCPLVEGYGLTESCAGGFLTDNEDYTVGHSGVLALTLSFKLVNVSELDYRVTDKEEGKLSPRGEICLRGPSIFLDYYKDQEKTNESVD